ncbi:MAG TPA: S41 family peptidase [Xanthomonadaceae bacterium]|nr:S41 family peptidase [Xanthomonadaceae bacterium]
MRLPPLLLPIVPVLACMALASAPAHAQDPAAGDTAPEDTPAAPNDPQAALADRGGEGATVPLDQIRRYVSVFNMVREAYVEPVDDSELMEAAIRGLLSDLDPHSAYLEHGDSEDLMDRTRGAYDGIGVELMRQDDGTLRVIAPIDDTPAARAGIKAGDIIVAIDGTPVAGSDPSSDPLRGAPGTEVVLTILREGEQAPLDITVVRDTIRVASVRGRMLEPGYGYIRISMFQADTGADFARELDALLARGGGSLDGLVIDLRSNPGGLLTTAVQVADELLEKGTIVSTRGRLAISDTRFTATPGDRLGGAPVVVLVDAGSASASEVLAGALQDNGRARVVGSRTFGKGSVQTALPLDNGDTVKLTTARYYTPSGNSIQALGIQPDVVLQPDEVTDGHPARVSEAVLAGHLDAEGEVVAELEPGNVLEGQAPIDAALAELKRMTSDAVTNRTG